MPLPTETKDIKPVQWQEYFTCRCACGCRSHFALLGERLCIHCTAEDHLQERP